MILMRNANTRAHTHRRNCDSSPLLLGGELRPLGPAKSWHTKRRHHHRLLATRCSTVLLSTPLLPLQKLSVKEERGPFSRTCHLPGGRPHLLGTPSSCGFVRITGMSHSSWECICAILLRTWCVWMGGCVCFQVSIQSYVCAIRAYQTLSLVV